MDGLNPSRATTPISSLQRVRRTAKHRDSKRRPFSLEDADSPPVEDPHEDPHEDTHDDSHHSTHPHRPDPDADTGQELDITG